MATGLAQWLLRAALTKHQKLCSLLSHRSESRSRKSGDVRRISSLFRSLGGGAVPGPLLASWSFPDPWQHNSNLHVVFLRTRHMVTPGQAASLVGSLECQSTRGGLLKGAVWMRAVLSYSKFGGTTWMHIPTNSHLS